VRHPARASFQRLEAPTEALVAQAKRGEFPRAMIPRRCRRPGRLACRRSQESVQARRTHCSPAQDQQRRRRGSIYVRDPMNGSGDHPRGPTSTTSFPSGTLASSRPCVGMPECKRTLTSAPNADCFISPGMVPKSEKSVSEKWCTYTPIPGYMSPKANRAVGRSRVLGTFDVSICDSSASAPDSWRDSIPWVLPNSDFDLLGQTATDFSEQF
jgi:hypothetical protein